MFDNNNSTFGELSSYQPEQSDTDKPDNHDDGFFDDVKVVRESGFLDAIEQKQASSATYAELEKKRIDDVKKVVDQSVRGIQNEEGYLRWNFIEVPSKEDKGEKKYSADTALHENAYKLADFNENMRKAITHVPLDRPEEFQKNIVALLNQIEFTAQELSAEAHVDANTAHPDMRASIDSFNAQRDYLQILFENPDLAEGVIENLQTDTEKEKQAKQKREERIQTDTEKEKQAKQEREERIQTDTEKEKQAKQEREERMRDLIKKFSESFQRVSEKNPIEFKDVMKKKELFEQHIERFEIDIALRNYDAEIIQAEIDTIDIDTITDPRERAAVKLRINTLTYERDRQRVAAEYLHTQKVATEVAFYTTDISLDDKEKDTLTMKALIFEEDRIAKNIDVIKTQSEFVLTKMPLAIDTNISELTEQIILFEQILDTISREKQAFHVRLETVKNNKLLSKIYQMPSALVDFYEGKIDGLLKMRKEELQSMERIAEVEKTGHIIVDPDLDLKIMDEVERKVDLEEIKRHLTKREQLLPKDSAIEMSFRQEMIDLKDHLTNVTRVYQLYVEKIQATQRNIDHREREIVEMGGNMREADKSQEGFIGRLKRVFGLDRRVEIEQKKSEIQQLTTERNESLKKLDELALRIVLDKGAMKYVEMNLPSALRKQMAGEDAKSVQPKTSHTRAA